MAVVRGERCVWRRGSTPLKKHERQGCTNMKAVDRVLPPAPMFADAPAPAPAHVRGAAHMAEVLSLTARERDVFEMVGLALTNREIASRLGLSEKTVKSHVTGVMRKLGVRNRVEAALIAARQKRPGGAAR